MGASFEPWLRNMNDPEYWRLIEAGYAPEQIMSCWPCRCKREGQPVANCDFPTHRGGVPLVPNVRKMMALKDRESTDATP